MRVFLFSALAIIAFTATMAVHPTPANAVIYCKTAGVPKGCLMRSAAPVAEPCLSYNLGQMAQSSVRSLATWGTHIRPTAHDLDAQP